MLPRRLDALCAPTSVLDSSKDASEKLTLNEGWIYFHNPSLKVVTEQDIRDDAVYSLVTTSTSNFPLSDLDDHIEVLLMHIQPGPQSPSSFNLVINHKHCIASYAYQEVKDKNFHSLDPNTRTMRSRIILCSGLLLSQ
jgi:hypothetical protein